MSFNWRQLPDSEMEKHFNPRAAVPDTEARLEGFIARSAAARAQMPGRYDLRYGDRPKETLDLHVPEANRGNAPLVMFIHGGYWRALDKSDHSFVVPPMLDSGAIVANINYDLCPTITLDEMVDEIANAVHYCSDNAESWGADPNNLYLFGHSAGAHLSAEMLLSGILRDRSAAWSIQGVAAITGIYEPEVILHVSVNEEAQIAKATAAGRNCLTRDFALKPKMVVAVGGDEPEGWIAQSAAFADVCTHAGLVTHYETVPGCNHFTVLERAISPGTSANKAVFGLWQR